MNIFEYHSQYPDFLLSASTVWPERMSSLSRPAISLLFDGWLLAQAVKASSAPVTAEVVPDNWVPELGEEVLVPTYGVGRVHKVEYMSGWTTPHRIHVQPHTLKYAMAFAPENVKPWRPK
jgi:hypothetical protein